MYAEKESVAQQLVNTPDLGIEITFTIRSVNLAEVWDHIMECVSMFIFLQSDQLLKLKEILSESLLNKPSGRVLAPLHTRYLCAGPGVLLQLD